MGLLSSCVRAMNWAIACWSGSKAIGSSIVFQYASHPRGRKPKDGPLFQGKRPETHAEAKEVCSEQDRTGRNTRTSRWNHLHFQQDRDLNLSVISVSEKQQKPKRDPVWLVCDAR